MLTAVRRGYFRAASFGEPLGPWRESKRQVARDLIEHGLGSYDECGRFFVMVPGQIESRHEWMVVDMPDEKSVEITSERRAKSRGRPRETPHRSLCRSGRGTGSKNTGRVAPDRTGIA